METQQRHLNQEQVRAMRMMMANKVRGVTRNCTTDDEKYRAIVDSLTKEWTNAIIHGPKQA